MTAEIREDVVLGMVHDYDHGSLFIRHPEGTAQVCLYGFPVEATVSEVEEAKRRIRLAEGFDR